MRLLCVLGYSDIIERQSLSTIQKAPSDRTHRAPKEKRMNQSSSHGYHRTTGDMDVWVNPTEENYMKLMGAFAAFGLPTDLISQTDFQNTENQDVFTFGLS